MVGHSLVSPVLFYLAAIVYDDRHSRSVIYAGHTRPHKLAKAGVGLFTGLNFGLPPFLVFWVELGLFSLYGSTFVLGLIGLVLTSFLSFAFSMCFYVARHGRSAGQSNHSIKPVYELVTATVLLCGLPVCGAALC